MRGYNAGIQAGKIAAGAKRPMWHQVCAAALASALIASGLPVAWAAGIADASGEASSSSSGYSSADAASNANSSGYSPAHTASSSNSASSSSDSATTSNPQFGGSKVYTALELPTSFDLRDPNKDGDTADSVVTPVKRQHPWGDCWAFSIIAASETSILASSHKTFNETGLDLSEKALVNTVFYNGGAPKGIVGKAQAKEGYTNRTTDPNQGFDLGGKPLYGSTLFSAGTGLLLEQDEPYKNAEGIMECSVTLAGQTEAQTMYLTSAQAESYKEQGASVVAENYAGNFYTSQDNREVTYTDWSSSKGIWGSTYLPLKNANWLPEIRKTDSDENYVSTNLDAVNNVKSELYQGRAVCAAYCAYDVRISVPQSKLSMYFDYSNWSHYTWQSDSSNHYVTIIGWDDNYSKDNFNSNNDEASKPQGDGAFLVKNSWGASTNDFPNYANWGIEDKDGNRTGCFWLSYYDKSVKGLMSFDFDTNGSTSSGKAKSYTDQYDYLPGKDTTVKSYEKPVSSANVFTAQEDVTIDSLGTTVWMPNTTTTYQVYLLDDKANAPTQSKHSKRVLAIKRSYAYAGYHRTQITKSKQVALRKGQRYAIVTQQLCNDDGMYYQGAVTNLKFRGFEAKVNAKESWTGKAANIANAKNGQVTWTDWKTKLDSMDEDDDDYYLAIDNLPIKAFGTTQNWASIKRLSKLDKAVTKASKTLKSAVVSKNGKGVAKTKTWISKAKKTKLTAAVKTGKKLLKKAGSYKTQVTTTTPTAAKVKTAIKAINSVKVGKGKAAK